MGQQTENDLFDHLVGAANQCVGDGDAERLGGLEKAASRPNDDFRGIDRLVGT